MTDAYQMARPDMAEAKAALQRLYGSTDVYTRLCGQAGLTGRETDPAAVERLITVMLAADPVTALCGRSLVIRLKSYEYLRAAADLIGQAPPEGARA